MNKDLRFLVINQHNTESDSLLHIHVTLTSYALFQTQHVLTELLEESRSQLVKEMLEAKMVFEAKDDYKSTHVEILASNDDNDKAIAEQISSQLSTYGIASSLLLSVM